MDALRYTQADFEDMCRFISNACYERGADIGYLGEDEMTPDEFVCAAVNEWVVTPLNQSENGEVDFAEFFETNLYGNGIAIENGRQEDLFEVLPNLMDRLLKYGEVRLSENDLRLAQAMDSFCRMFTPPVWRMSR